ncbi:MAG TPA: SNF2-related protein, partial [Rhodopila sp.]|nr:SNF2-related protein [Rhodopila sp.]
MPTPFSSQDLGRVFDARALTRGRSLGLAGGVTVQLEGDTISAVVQDRAGAYNARITPALLGRRVMFDHHCSCGTRACSHLAAAALAALDQFPALRKAEQRSLFDSLTAEPEKERQRVVFDLAPAEPPNAFAVTTLLIGERSGAVTPTTPQALADDETANPKARDLARLLGGGGESCTLVPMTGVSRLLPALVDSGQARWHAGSKRLVKGETRVFTSASAEALPPRSGVIVGDTGPWYVDAATGAVAPVRIRPVQEPAEPAAPASDAAQLPAHSSPPRADAPKAEPPRRATPASSTELVIVERPMTPVLRLAQVSCPDEAGRMQALDALLLTFDYDGATIPFDDERQFVRAVGPDGPIFIRRDRSAEAAVQEALRQDGLVQMRLAAEKTAKGRIVLAFRGRDAAEAWQAFVTERMPVLQAMGWRSEIDAAFGPRFVDSVGVCDVQIADAPQGGFSLELGIEIDGARRPLLPILMRLRERGGMDAARIVDGEVITSLDDGRILKLPADRTRHLLAIVDDLIETASRTTSDSLVMDAEAAPAVLDLEDLVTARWQDAATIAAHVERFRAVNELPEAPVPPSFKASLRAYQQQGVNWLQHLRQNGLGGLLADDMGLGKTAQTIAHIVIEEAEGRLDRPVLIVVPTSLVPNWTAELSRFAPHLRIAVLHGLDRHDRRRDLSGVHVAITTYTVLARDIEEMAELSWHIVVLDEAQAIKSPTAKATQAVCRLDTRHRLCLSGTPIENNLGELWSQFAFLMPG